MLTEAFRRLEEGLIAFLLAAMTGLTFVQVVLRYVFNSGFTWALEATTYMFGWLVLLGISYGVKVGSHIGVDILIQQLSPRNRRIAATTGAVLSVGYAAILLIGSYNYVDTMHTLDVEAEDLPIQRWLLLMALPIGFTLLLIRFAQAAWRIASGHQTTILADEAKEALDQFADLPENRAADRSP
jgi:C4-dicarboxylate transporter DctQ subunit